ncbi:hypothetical protein DFQ30_004542, partial [Apophysomyces sp. BC1015]
MERDVVARRQRVEVLVVRHDRRDLDRKLSGAVSEQQVVQAVPDLRHHDHDARLDACIVQFPSHPELRGQRLEVRAQRVQPGIAADLLEVHAHEELTRVAVAELRGVQDIATALEQEPGHRMDDARPVGTGEFENEAVFGGHANNPFVLSRHRVVLSIRQAGAAGNCPSRVNPAIMRVCYTPRMIAKINGARALQLAQHVLDIEASAIRGLGTRLNGEFVVAVEMLLACKGRVVVSGIGKSGHIARKLAATLASTGTPAFFVHPAEASHGDLGMVTADD